MIRLVHKKQGPFSFFPLTKLLSNSNCVNRSHSFFFVKSRKRMIIIITLISSYSHAHNPFFPPFYQRPDHITIGIQREPHKKPEKSGCCVEQMQLSFSTNLLLHFVCIFILLTHSQIPQTSSFPILYCTAYKTASSTHYPSSNIPLEFFVAFAILQES